MNRLQKVVDAVMAEIAKSPDLGPIEVLVGAKRITQHTGKRRIVWVRSGQQNTIRYNANRAAGRQHEGARAPSPYDRLERIRVSLSAEDEDELDLLFDEFLAALANVSSNDSGITAQEYVWTTEEGHTERRPLIECFFTMVLPVLQRPQVLFTRATTTHNCSIITPAPGIQP